MSKHAIDGFITWKHAARMDHPRIDFLTYDPRGLDDDSVVVRAHSIEVEVPDDFDPRPAQVAALREKAAATFSAYVAEIDASISKLLAIE